MRVRHILAGYFDVSEVHQKWQALWIGCPGFSTAHCANVAMNALRNVLTFQNAVADGQSTNRIPVIDPRRKYNFTALAMKEHTAGEEVVVIDIDSLQLPFCNLIKIDVEGMETLVLNGARSTIERFRPVLFVENNTFERSREIIETIHSLGYRAYRHLANYYNSGNYFGIDVNIFAGFRTWNTSPANNFVSCVPSRKSETEPHQIRETPLIFLFLLELCGRRAGDCPA